MIAPPYAALTGALVAALTGAPLYADSTAGSGGRYTAYADVVAVSPRYGWHEVSEPVRECVELAERRDYRYDDRYDDRYESRYRYRHDGADTAASLVGGLIGGLIGHQFGGGHGKTAFTVAGAALGASIARDRSRRYDERSYARVEAAPVRRCTETVQTRQVRGVDGYDVTYRYQGRTFHKWMHEHPGDTVAVDVAVEPLLGASG